VFQHLVEAGRRPAFLHSGDGGGPGGRWSIIALDREGVFQVSPDDARDPFEALRDELGRFSVQTDERPPIPFVGGWVGYFSYDLAHRVERLRTAARVDHGFPLIELAFYQTVLAYDHDGGMWTACRLVDEGASVARAKTELHALLDEIGSPSHRPQGPVEKGALSKPFGLCGDVLLPPNPGRCPGLCYEAPSGQQARDQHPTSRQRARGQHPSRDPAFSAGPHGEDAALVGGLESDFTRDAYENAVRRALDDIAAGDIYQVNLAQRFEGRLAIAPEELALRLFESSPAPFGAFMRFGDRAVVSSSPERFLVVRGRDVETWPVKGTRPRGETPAEDERMKAELLASDKEQAELVMITDLLRNDLGRVCEYGSVRVPELRAVASHRNVHHTYSRIAGRLRDDVSLADLLRATLPGGSITGAPKVRAMEIIEELEPTARGPYCGAIGWMGVDGAMDLAIAIRTILIEGQRLTFHVGAGIVADSDPAAEYDETLHKARGMMCALGVETQVPVA